MNINFDVENLHIDAHNADDCRQDAALSKRAQAFSDLKADFLAAFKANVKAELRTPRGADQPGLRRASMTEIVADMLAKQDPDHNAIGSLLVMCASMARFGHLPATALRDELARMYADAYCDDLAQEQGE